MRNRRLRPLIPILLDLAFLSGLLVIIEASTTRFAIKAALFQLYCLLGLPWILNLGILGAGYALARLVFGKRNRAFAFMLFLALSVSSANFLKLASLSLPILPSDLYLVTELDLLLSFVSPAFLALVGGLMLAVVGLTAWIEWKLRDHSGYFNRVSRKKALAAALAGVAYLAILVRFQDVGLDEPLHAADISVNLSNPYYEAWHDGLLLTYVMNVEYNLALIPEGYSKERMASLVASHGQGAREASSRHPNVVLVLVESAWDPSPLVKTGGKIEPDPLVELKRLGKKGYAGRLVSPVFGGRTANVEFEILTGLSTRFLPRGSVAYQQFLARRTESLAWKFKRNGYRTLALHNWNQSFWRRDKVYPWLGFDDYLGKESLGVETPERGFPADGVLYDRMAREIVDSDRPVFGMVITVSTHGGYGYEHPAKEKARITGSRLRGPVLREAETYATALLHADRALGEFSRKLEALDEETIVVVFGDHLPVLGRDYGAYVQSGFVKGPREDDWSREERLAMSSTPLAIWSSKGSLKDALAKDGPERMSACFLGSEVLRLSGIGSTGALVPFLFELRKSLPVVHPDFAIDAEGRFVDRKAASKLEDYWLFTYDRVFGENYSDPR